MNLKKVFKLLMCSVCLGLAIVSNAALATEESNEIDELVEELYDEVIKGGRNAYYINYYTYLISEGKKEDEARRGAEMCSKLIESGKSAYYADCYINSILEGVEEEEAMKRAEIYTKLRESGKSVYYANYYIYLILEGKKENEAMRRAEMYSNLITEEGKSEDYAGYYTSYYSELIVRGIEKKEAKRRAEIYSKLREEGRSASYANYHANLVLSEGKKSKTHMEKYFTLVGADAKRKKELSSKLSNKSKVYIGYYVKLLVKGCTEEIADIQAEIYEKEKSLNKSDEEADRIAKEESYKIYKKEIERKEYDYKKERQSEIYARYYSKVKANQVFKKELK